jgi:hypothetical protein
MGPLSKEKSMDRIEIEELKKEWESDPHWDLENTPGFEEHHDDLLTHRHEKEAEWESARLDALEKKARELGIPGRLALTGYILSLENRIQRLKDNQEEEIQRHIRNHMRFCLVSSRT